MIQHSFTQNFHFLLPRVSNARAITYFLNCLKYFFNYCKALFKMFYDEIVIRLPTRDSIILNFHRAVDESDLKLVSSLVSSNVFTIENESSYI